MQNSKIVANLAQDRALNNSKKTKWCPHSSQFVVRAFSLVLDVVLCPAVKAGFNLRKTLRRGTILYVSVTTTSVDLH